MRKCKDALIIDARDIPNDVNDWCCENEISTHYENSLHCLRTHVKVAENEYEWQLQDSPLVNCLGA